MADKEREFTPQNPQTERRPANDQRRGRGDQDSGQPVQLDREEEKRPGQPGYQPQPGQPGRPTQPGQPGQQPGQPGQGQPGQGKPGQSGQPTPQR